LAEKEVPAAVVLDRARRCRHDSFVPSERVRKLLAEASELPTEERVELVDELARTLPDDYDEDDLDVDYAKLDRRRQEVEDGTVAPVAWERVSEKLRSRS
jgi:putative addiction module component (TIGR02574 family)